MHISSNIISNLLLQNINESLPAETHLDKALTWRKSLSTYIYKERNWPARKEIW